MFRLAVIGILSVALSACVGPFWWGPGGPGGPGGPHMQPMGGYDHIGRP